MQPQGGLGDRDPSLADFQGDVISLDPNVLVGLVDAASEYHVACAAFFQRDIDPAHPIQLITATLTVDAVIFVLLQKLLVREPYHITRSRSQYLQDHPDIVRELMEQVDPLVDALCALVTLEPVTAADIDQMRQEMQVSGLLPRDAVRPQRDEGFDHCQGMTLFQP